MASTTTSTETLNFAISGTYVIHLTTVPMGTIPRRVRPICGASTRSSYMWTATQEQVDKLEAHGSKRCAKCHG